MHYNGPLRVAIDARQLWELGIGTYVRNLIGGLVRAGGAELELTLLLPPRPWRDAWWDPVARAAGIPGARYVELAHASHGAPIQCAGEVNALLDEHFARAEGTQKPA